jgi:tRNA U34 5-methylaminomethyl-2-thiouridine-forming methyltransferase MnmC
MPELALVGRRLVNETGEAVVASFDIYQLEEIYEKIAKRSSVRAPALAGNSAAASAMSRLQSLGVVMVARRGCCKGRPGKRERRQN